MLAEEFKNLRETMPPLEGRGHYGQEQFDWLARAQQLVSAWNFNEGYQFKKIVDALLSRSDRHTNYAKLIVALNRATNAVQVVNASDASQAVFGPGAVYDFFKAFRALTQSAKSELFIIDPYLDPEIFDAYLVGVNPSISVRLLANRYKEDLKAASTKFTSQNKHAIEIRASSSLHDRVLFVDGSACWVLGASIKDAAKSKMTYLTPLSPDVVSAKLAHYNGSWASATAI